LGSIAECLAALPVEYLPTGDKALITAWAVLQADDRPGHDYVAAVLCLEDGSSVIAETSQFKFDYRWHQGKQKFVDVSAIPDAGDEEPDADTDQEHADLGGQSFPGPVPDPDRADEGDPGDEPQR
jgi:hypothetical protein